MAPSPVRHRVHRTLRGLSPLLCSAALLSCIPDNHPLSGDGEAKWFYDSTPIYAVDELDLDGNAALPRQVPYERQIQILMSTEGAADPGAYVDVLISPPNSVELHPADNSCEQLSGAFRCVAGDDGYATFLVRSERIWSGDVTMSLANRSNSENRLTVNSAGLPSDGSVLFNMLIQGVDGSNVPPRYNALACTVDPEPDNTFDKWEGVRIREAEIQATAPPGTPGIIEHAPVIIQSTHPEVFVTFDPTCEPPRKSRLRVQLDALGISPKFYFCFSEVGGGDVILNYTSGGQARQRNLVVAAEPRLLRVVTTLDMDVPADGIERDAILLTAFDADLNQVSLKVDIKSSDSSVFTVSTSSATLAGSTGGVGDPPSKIRILPNAEGTANIEISPELYASPVCTSALINVVP